MIQGDWHCDRTGMAESTEKGAYLFLRATLLPKEVET